MTTHPRIKPETINIDLSKRAVVHETSAHWLATPMPGVERRHLERDGGESARRATTILRYASGSRYSPHTHNLGEEFLVLEGIFSDEVGDYPAGTYVRNPHGSSMSKAVILKKWGTEDNLKKFYEIKPSYEIWQAYP